MKEIKSGKAPGLDGFPVECLKRGWYCSIRVASETIKRMF